MPSLFCWGDRLTPHLVLDQTNDAVIIQVDGEPKTIQQSKVKGWAREGDCVRVLMGYNWCNGTVLGGDTLRVDLDTLGIVPIHKTGVMQPLYVPASEPSKKSRRKKLKSTEAAPPCDFCGDPSTLWCDGRIKTGVHQLGTCDRPMCRSCAKQVGNMFGCNRRKPSQSFADTVDWCPDCVAAQEQFEKSDDFAEQLTKSDDFVGKGEPRKEVSFATVDKLDTVDKPNRQLNHDLGANLSTVRDSDHISKDKLTDQGELTKKVTSLSLSTYESVPMPALEDYEEDEMGIAKQYDLLEHLQVGDRVRIVLAGSPLEHLVGSLGTVEGEETFGLIPVKIDGDRSVVLRREQVDKIEAEETMGIPIVSSDGHPAGEAGHPCIGSKVQSDRAFKAKVGIVREIKDGTAMVEFGDGIPLYPCAIASLRVVS